MRAIWHLLRACCRALFALVPSAGVMRFVRDALIRVSHDADVRMRQIEARKSPSVNPAIISFDGGLQLHRSIREARSPWRALPLDTVPSPPTMIHDEEKRYYAYVTRFYSGMGAVVELGPWLGGSTFYILHGLLANPHFMGRRLHVYDNFV